MMHDYIFFIWFHYIMITVDYNTCIPFWGWCWVQEHLRRQKEFTMICLQKVEIKSCRFTAKVICGIKTYIYFRVQYIKALVLVQALINCMKYKISHNSK